MAATFRPRTLRPAVAVATAVGLMGAVLAAPSKTVPPELPPETLSAGTIGPEHMQRVYVFDDAISHLSDGRVRVFDARSGKYLGMVSTAYAANFALAAKHDKMYVATTHLARSYRGERVDVLEVYDTTSLAFEYEVVLPSKRAQTLSYRNLVRPTANARFVLVQNATPATSVTVVDLESRKVSAEIPTPGCWGVLPAASHGARFSMLCGDGSVATVTLDDNGQLADRQVAAKIFDADTDPWFHHAEQSGDRYWFLSFKGTLTELNLGGAVATVKSSLPLVGAADAKAHWRPGGYQPFAIDGAGRWMVVAMHAKGTEGTHKRPADKLWVFDLAARKRSSIVPGGTAIAMTFNGSGDRLNILDAAKSGLGTWSFDSGRLKKLAYVPQAGETSTYVESHD